MAGNGTSPFYVGNTSCKGRSISHCYFSLPECMQHMGVSLKWWYPQIIHFNRGFHYFHHPFWGYHYFKEPPHIYRYKFPNELRNAHGVFWRMRPCAEVDLGMVMVLSSRHLLMRRWRGRVCGLVISYLDGGWLFCRYVLSSFWGEFFLTGSQVRVDYFFSEYIIVDWYFYVGGSADPRNIT